LGAICTVVILKKFFRNFVLLLAKQRTISSISRCPNLTTFEHNTSIGVAVKTFGTEF